MVPVNVTTSLDFARQNLTNGGLAKEVENPVEGVDPSIQEVIVVNGISDFFINFDGVKVLSRQSPTYPNPTLNHFVLSLYLKESGARAKKFMDLGCGVGFMGNYAGVHLGPEEIMFADLDQNAVGQSIHSYGFNQNIENVSVLPQEPHNVGVIIKAPKHTLDARVGDAAQSTDGYDAEGGIAVAAPMYIPGICEVFPQAFQLFAFVAKNTGANLYVAHTNLASDLVEDAANRMKLEREVMMERELPFVAEYSNMAVKPGLVDHLRAKGLEIKGNEAFHKIVVSKLSDRNS